MNSIVALASQREAGREIPISSEDSGSQWCHTFARQVLRVLAGFIVPQTKRPIPSRILQAEEYWTMLHHHRCEIATGLRVAVFADRSAGLVLNTIAQILTDY